MSELIATSEELCHECERLTTITQDVQSTTIKAITRPIMEIVYADTTVKRPEYKTSGSSGMDVCAWLAEPVTIAPGERTLIPTGIRVSVEEGFELQVRPRSGLALTHGITVINSPGTIDADFRGSIGIILINLGTIPFTVNNGDRIAQLVLARVEKAIIMDVNELSSTTRGEGGYGSTGVK